MKINEIFNESLDESQLNEKLGNLAQLKLGRLVNLLRQSRTAGEDERRFQDRNIGAGSEIIDVGELTKGIASLRKAYKSANDGPGAESAVAFALYIGDTAIAFGRFTSDVLRGSTREGTFAYDLTPFKEILDKQFDDRQAANPNVKMYRASNALTSYHEKPPSYFSTSKEPRRYTGVELPTSGLGTKIDEFAELAKLVGEPLTAKIVMSDKASDAKRLERYSNRQIESGRESLSRRLERYKLSKKPSANTVEEFIEYVKGVRKVADKVQFAGFTYSTTPERDTVDVGSLMSGHPFRIRYRASDPGSWEYLTITYVFDKNSMTIKPSHAVWTNKETRNSFSAVLDADAYIRGQLGDVNTQDKDSVIPALLAKIKAKEFRKVQDILTGLKQAGRDWPELAIIQRSVDAELEKKD